MSEHHHWGPPMDPSNPLLRVDLLLDHDDGGFHVVDNSNVPLGIKWDLAFAIFVREDQAYVLPPGDYIFTVRHGEGFRVSELPTEGLSEQTRQALIDHLQPFCEETFRALCVGLVSFPTPREILLVAQGLVGASAQTAIESLYDPDKFDPDFLTLVPVATNRLGSSRKIEQDGLVALLIQEDGISLPGGMVAMPGTPDETGHLEVKVGYLPEGSLNDWLNAALVMRLTEVVPEVRADVLRKVVVTLEDRRAWYERASASLKRFLGR